MSNAYIDGTPATGTENAILSWEPRGRAGNYQIPVVFDKNPGTNASYDAEKIRMNANVFVPQPPSSKSPSSLRLSREGNPSWKRPVVAWYGEHRDSNDVIELSVDLRDYTEICVGHEFEGEIEVSPWYSLLPMRQNKAISGQTRERDFEAVLAEADYDPSNHDSGLFSLADFLEDEDDAVEGYNEARIAVLAPFADIVMIQPITNKTKTFTHTCADGSTTHELIATISRIETTTYNQISFRGIAAGPADQNPLPNPCYTPTYESYVRYHSDNGPVYGQRLTSPDSNGNPRFVNTPTNHRVGEQGNDGRGVDDLRYILVR